MFFLPSRFLVQILLLVSLQSCFFNNQTLKPDAGTLAVREYKAGLSALKGDDLVQAEIHFRNALDAQDKFAPGLEGMARIHIKRNNILEAERYLERAIQSDLNWVPAYIIKSRLYLKNEDFDLAREELLLAQKLIKRHRLKSFEEEIQPLLAEACYGLGNFEAAAEHYKRALRQIPNDVQIREKLAAAKFYAQILKNKSGRLNQVMQRDQITRGDLALLMRNFLKFDLHRQSPVQNPIHDLPLDKELAEAIKMCTVNYYLPVLPDQTFRPSDKVDRAEMALFIEQILSRNYPYYVPLDSMYVGDVGPYEPFTRAVHLVLALQFMARDAADQFRPYAYLAGPEALQIIHRLSAFLKVPVFPAHFLRDQSGEAKQN